MRYLTLILFFPFLYSCDEAAPVASGRQSISYELDTLSNEAKLENGETYFNFFIEELKIDSEGDSTVLFINNRIQKNLLEANLSFAENPKSYQALFDSICAEYQRLLSSDYPPIGPWDLSQSIRVIHNDNGLFSYQSTHSAFTGGAHPNQYSSTQLFRLRDGALLNLDSIVLEGQMADFKQLGESIFRNEYHIAEGDRLNDADFWFDENEFRFPENFTLDSTGLHFHYNAYDIAPYAMGHFFIDIPPRYLNDYLKPEYIINPIPAKSPES